MQLSLPLGVAQPTRLFVPDKAPLERVAEWIVQSAPAHERVVDVQSLVAVLPTARSGRRLLELLVDKAEARKRGLLPPRILTPGGLYALLGESAPPALVRLAWMQTVLTQADACRAAFGEACTTQREALELASLCERMDRELMGAGHTFAALAGERYAALERLRVACVAMLRGWGCVDPRQLLEQGKVTLASLLLVGIVDLPALLQRKLPAAQTTVMVLAPEHWRERFDAWGGLVKAPWLAAQLEVRDDQLAFVGGAREQADAAARFLAEQAGRSTRDVSIAVLDEEVTSPLEYALARAGAAAHVALPLPFAAQPVARLLQAAADFLEQPDVETLATLVRHPDVAATHALPAFDRYREEHLPERVEFPGEHKAAVVSRELAERVDALLGGLRGDPRSLGAWAAQVLAFLSRIYGERSLQRTQPDDRRLLDTLNAVMRTAEAVQPAQTSMSAAEAMRFMLAATGDEAIARDAHADAVELFGWLELPLDDAAVTIAVGCNEGKLPPAVNADAFLPNGARQKLGLTDNDARYARDAYVLSGLLRTRERLLLVAGRRSLVGDPLLPSRLLLACEGRVAARRIERFFAHDDAAAATPATAFSFSVPEPDPRDEAPRELPVTSFGEYLLCPYRFYLKRVLKLRQVDDTAREMTPRVSGVLVHEALQAFGRGPHAHETEVRHIREAMREALWSTAAKKLGAPSMAVRAQLGQLEQRLDGLALWQARWVGEGWRIAHCEVKLAEPFMVDEQPVFLQGTIDRIDEHPDHGVAILDYKTSENARDPEEKHLRRGEWVDLQLPLYRELWRLRGDGRPAQLGFVNIAKNPRETRARLARWTEADLQPAYETARQVVRQVRQRVFWPPNPTVTSFEEFDWIVQCGAPQ